MRVDVSERSEVIAGTRLGIFWNWHQAEVMVNNAGVEGPERRSLSEKEIREEDQCICSCNEGMCVYVIVRVRMKVE